MNDHFYYVATFNKKYFNCFACSSSSEKLHSEKLGRENYRNTARIFTTELLQCCEPIDWAITGSDVIPIPTMTSYLYQQ